MTPTMGLFLFKPVVFGVVGLFGCGVGGVVVFGGWFVSGVVINRSKFDACPSSSFRGAKTDRQTELRFIV